MWGFTSSKSSLGASNEPLQRDGSPELIEESEIDKGIETDCSERSIECILSFDKIRTEDTESSVVKEEIKIDTIIPITEENLEEIDHNSSLTIEETQSDNLSMKISFESNPETLAEEINLSFTEEKPPKNQDTTQENFTENIKRKSTSNFEHRSEEKESSGRQESNFNDSERVFSELFVESTTTQLDREEKALKETQTIDVEEFSSLKNSEEEFYDQENGNYESKNIEELEVINNAELNVIVDQIKQDPGHHKSIVCEETEVTGTSVAEEPFPVNDNEADLKQDKKLERPESENFDNNCSKEPPDNTEVNVSFNPLKQDSNNQKNETCSEKNSSETSTVEELSTTKESEGEMIKEEAYEKVESKNTNITLKELPFIPTFDHLKQDSDNQNIKNFHESNLQESKIVEDIFINKISNNEEIGKETVAEQLEKEEIRKETTHEYLESDNANDNLSEKPVQARVVSVQLQRNSNNQISEIFHESKAPEIIAVGKFSSPEKFKEINVQNYETSESDCVDECLVKEQRNTQVDFEKYSINQNSQVSNEIQTLPDIDRLKESNTKIVNTDENIENIRGNAIIPSQDIEKDKHSLYNNIEKRLPSSLHLSQLTEINNVEFDSRTFLSEELLSQKLSLDTTSKEASMREEIVSNTVEAISTTDSFQSTQSYKLSSLDSNYIEDLSTLPSIDSSHFNEEKILELETNKLSIEHEKSQVTVHGIVKQSQRYTDLKESSREPKSTGMKQAQKEIIDGVQEAARIAAEAHASSSKNSQIMHGSKRLDKLISKYTQFESFMRRKKDTDKEETMQKGQRNPGKMLTKKGVEKETAPSSIKNLKDIVDNPIVDSPLINILTKGADFIQGSYANVSEFVGENTVELKSKIENIQFHEHQNIKDLSLNNLKNETSQRIGLSNVNEVLEKIGSENKKPASNPIHHKELHNEENASNFIGVGNYFQKGISFLQPHKDSRPTSGKASYEPSHDPFENVLNKNKTINSNPEFQEIETKSSEINAAQDTTFVNGSIVRETSQANRDLSGRKTTSNSSQIIFASWNWASKFVEGTSNSVASSNDKNCIMQSDENKDDDIEAAIAATTNQAISGEVLRGKYGGYKLAEKKRNKDEEEPLITNLNKNLLTPAFDRLKNLRKPEPSVVKAKSQYTQTIDLTDRFLSPISEGLTSMSTIFHEQNEPHNVQQKRIWLSLFNSDIDNRNAGSILSTSEASETGMRNEMLYPELVEYLWNNLSCDEYCIDLKAQDTIYPCVVNFLRLKYETTIEGNSESKTDKKTVPIQESFMLSIISSKFKEASREGCNSNSSKSTYDFNSDHFEYLDTIYPETIYMLEMHENVLVTLEKKKFFKTTNSNNKKPLLDLARSFYKARTSKLSSEKVLKNESIFGSTSLISSLVNMKSYVDRRTSKNHDKISSSPKLGMIPGNDLDFRTSSFAVLYPSVKKYLKFRCDDIETIGNNLVIEDNSIVSLDISKVTIYQPIIKLLNIKLNTGDLAENINSVTSHQEALQSFNLTMYLDLIPYLNIEFTMDSEKDLLTRARLIDDQVVAQDSEDFTTSHSTTVIYPCVAQQLGLTVALSKNKQSIGPSKIVYEIKNKEYRLRFEDTVYPEIAGILKLNPSSIKVHYLQDNILTRSKRTSNINEEGSQTRAQIQNKELPMCCVTSSEASNINLSKSRFPSTRMRTPRKTLVSSLSERILSSNGESQKILHSSALVRSGSFHTLSEDSAKSDNSSSQNYNRIVPFASTPVMQTVGYSRSSPAHEWLPSRHESLRRPKRRRGRQSFDVERGSTNHSRSSTPSVGKEKKSRIRVFRPSPETSVGSERFLVKRDIDMDISNIKNEEYNSVTEDLENEENENTILDSKAFKKTLSEINLLQKAHSSSGATILMGNLSRESYGVSSSRPTPRREASLNLSTRSLPHARPTISRESSVNLSTYSMSVRRSSILHDSSASLSSIAMPPPSRRRSRSDSFVKSKKITSRKARESSLFLHSALGTLDISSDEDEDEKKSQDEINHNSLSNFQFNDDYAASGIGMLSSSASPSFQLILKCRWRQMVARWRHSEMMKALTSFRPISHQYRKHVMEPNGGISASTSASSVTTRRAHLDNQHQNLNDDLANDEYKNLNGFTLSERQNDDIPLLSCCFLQMGTVSKQDSYSLPKPINEKGTLRQRIKDNDKPTVADYIKRAKDHLELFSEIITRVIACTNQAVPSSTSINSLPGPDQVTLKSHESIERKATRKYGGDISQVKDILRAQIVLDDEDSVLAALLALKKEKELKVVRVKNLFHCFNSGEMVCSSLPTGYRHVLVNVRFKGGFLAEIQIHLVQMYNLLGEEGYALHQQLLNLQALKNEKDESMQEDGQILLSEPKIIERKSKAHVERSDANLISDEYSFDYYIVKLFQYYSSNSCNELSMGNNMNKSYSSRKTCHRAIDLLILVAREGLQKHPRDIARSACLTEILKTKYFLYNRMSDKIRVIDAMKRSLVIADQANSTGMLGWLEYGSSTSLDRTIVLPLSLLSHLASFHAKCNDWTNATRTYWSLVMRCEQSLPLYHPLTLSSMLDLAACILAKGDSVGASSVIQRASERFRFYLAQQETLISQQYLKKKNFEEVWGRVFSLKPSKEEERQNPVDHLQMFLVQMKTLNRRHMALILGENHPVNILFHCFIGDILTILANCIDLISSNLENSKISHNVKWYRRLDEVWKEAVVFYSIALRNWTNLSELYWSSTYSICTSLARCLRELNYNFRAYNLLSRVISESNDIDNEERQESAKAFDARFLRGKNICTRVIQERTNAICLWWMAVYFAEYNPDERGRIRALSLLQTSSKAISRLSKKYEQKQNMEMLKIVEKETESLTLFKVKSLNDDNEDGKSKRIVAI